MSKGWETERKNVYNFYIRQQVEGKGVNRGTLEHMTLLVALFQWLTR